MGDKCKINNKALEKLRVQINMLPEELAKKTGISFEKYLEIEKGTDSPTPKQLLDIAEVLRRPLIVFFINEEMIESELALPVDHRKNRDEKITPEVYLAIRRAHYVIDTIKELSNLKSNLPKMADAINSNALAAQIRKDLKITLKDLKNKTENQVLSYYKDIIENKYDITIFEQPFKASGVRAFSVYSDISAIVLNEQDKAHIKIFSLFHELCHLIRREDGLCSIDFSLESRERVEQFCNKFAAEVLMPVNKFSEIAKSLMPMDYGDICRLSKIFCVSKEAILIRLKNLKIIEEDDFKLLSETNKSFGLKKGMGRRIWKNVYLNRNGYRLFNIVIEAYKSKTITYSQTLNILNINSKYLRVV